MPARSDQLIADWVVSTGSVDLTSGPVPSGQVWLAKRLTAACVVGAGGVSWYVTLANGHFAWLWAATLTAPAYDDHDTWLVLEAGDSIHAAFTNPAGGVQSALCSGAKLFL